ncbi:MAG: hypothetical protein KBT03_00205 [Bacteroidales bacterium]|nr:hypothetical protein [Candidatus Scybalousia scybalohippi]
MKDLLEFCCFIVMGVVLILTIFCSFVHIVSKNACSEYGERKGLKTDYEFYSGCWVETEKGVWNLKSSLEKGV